MSSQVNYFCAVQVIKNTAYSSYLKKIKQIPNFIISYEFNGIYKVSIALGHYKRMGIIWGIMYR